MKHETYHEEPGLGGYFPGREKQGCFSRSLQGCDACVARVDPGGATLECEQAQPAQRIYGGPGNTLPIPAPEHENVIVHK